MRLSLSPSPSSGGSWSSRSDPLSPPLYPPPVHAIFRPHHPFAPLALPRPVAARARLSLTAALTRQGQTPWMTPTQAARPPSPRGAPLQVPAPASHRHPSSPSRTSPTSPSVPRSFSTASPLRADCLRIEQPAARCIEGAGPAPFLTLCVRVTRALCVPMERVKGAADMDDDKVASALGAAVVVDDDDNGLRFAFVTHTIHL